MPGLPTLEIKIIVVKNSLLNPFLLLYYCRINLSITDITEKYKLSNSFCKISCRVIAETTILLKLLYLNNIVCSVPFNDGLSPPERFHAYKNF